MEDIGVVSIKRVAYDQATFEKAYRLYEEEPKESLCEKFKNKGKAGCTLNKIGRVFLNRFPCIDWLKRYDLKGDLVSDLVAGMTIAIFQVPQGMAYAMLANVPPIYGLYTSFFPVLIYALMGTSKQASIGTFAITSLMTGVIVNQYATFELGDFGDNSTMPPELNSSVTNTERKYSPIEVASAATLVCGIFQVIFGILQLGQLSVLLSEHLVSGFTCGSAVHVVTSQVKTLFGLNLEASDSGLLGLVYVYIEFFRKITRSNPVTLALSVVTLVILLIFKEVINAKLKKYTRVPFPIELLLVIMSTLVSVQLNLTEKNKVAIVGPIQMGFPSPVVPSMDLILKVAKDCVALSVVGFSSTISLAKIFASKYNYEINANQETLALGSANICGGFFLCIPCSGSISRSAVQDGAGGKTQMVSFINCAGLLVVLLAIGYLLEPLPQCILAAIIVVSLKNMLFQAKDFWKYWKQSYIDGTIWMVTFVAVLFMDVDLGLGIGVAFALLSLVYRSIRPDIYSKIGVKGTELYVSDDGRYTSTDLHPGVKVFYFGGPLHFANAAYFSDKVIKLANIQQSKNNSEQHENRHKSSSLQSFEKELGDVNSGFDSFQDGIHGDVTSVCVISSPNVRQQGVTSVHRIVLDCSSMSFIDLSGVKALRMLSEELEQHGVQFSIASCSRKVINFIKKDDYFKSRLKTSVFPSLQDAFSHQFVNLDVLVNSHCQS